MAEIEKVSKEPAFSQFTVYELLRSLVFLAVLAIASTPLPKKLYNKYADTVAVKTALVVILPAVLKADSKENLDKVKSIIEGRKKTMELGDKGFYDPEFGKKMEESITYEDGLFVIFLLTENIEKAKKAIESLKE